MRVSMKQFDYFKRHPDVLIEELFGTPLTEKQKILLRDLTAREEFQNIVQVVRCKSCKHWHREMSKDGKVEYINYSYCAKGQFGNGHDYYCPYGERNSNV